MWKYGNMLLLSALLFGLLIIGLPARSPGQRVGETAVDHTEWIANALKEIQSIRVGMSRKDLLKVFTTEGGLSSRFSRTYVYKKCPYIKVKVEFQAAQGSEATPRESANDKIVQISKPYLENPISD